jgi:hypothetical protein
VSILDTVGEKTVAKSNLTVRSETESFDALHLRFMSLMSRFQVVSEILGNCENLPQELGSAGYVLNKTTTELAQLYDDLEVWHMNHKRTSKAPKEVIRR